ncbi:MAG: precorrin-6y C5,15-methyltransferase (decarboxylating) subunit CbiE [Christensenellales bacterium]
MKINVVGGGLGSIDFLTGAGISEIKSADVVLTSLRLNDEFSNLNPHIKIMGIMDTVEYLKENSSNRDLNVAVLASGDVGFYSIATTLRKHLDYGFEIELIPGISSFQYFAAKLRMGYEDWKLISMHGLDKSIVPYASYYNKTFALTGGKWDVPAIINDLVRVGLGDVKIYIGERLGMQGEKITVNTPEALVGMNFDKLSVILIENENYTTPYTLFKDEDYIRGKAPITKEHVRNLSVDALSVCPTDFVWDVGAGSGGVTCALALKAHESTVYAIEMKEEALEVLDANVKALKTYNVEIISGSAPDALLNLPAPTKVFLGGTTGRLEQILDVVLSKNPNATIVANAITLETIGAIIEVFKNKNLKTEIISATIAKSKRLGNYNMMMGENPIYIVKGERDEEN